MDQKEKKKIVYRIKTADGKIKFAGTDEPSWFCIDRARELVDYSKGEKIVESDGVNIFPHEIL